MNEINQDVNTFLFDYCRFLSQELKNRDEELEDVRKQLKDEIRKNQQYKKEMVNISVLERWKVGEYLHDNLAQKLTYAKILTGLLKNKLSKKETDIKSRCDEILEIISESEQDVRDLSHDILPMDVEEEGVSQAFKYLQEQANRLGVNCKLEAGEIIHKINRRKVATNLYHIAQEAIKNAVIHGEANNVKIALFEHNRQLYLHVKDDGKGLGSLGISDDRGMGITIMKHRAEEIGGSLRIRDAEETAIYNTYVTCALPLKALAN